ncbi:MAG: cell division protein FtsQ [Bacteroidales bacterium]|nr:cell division protein FtsQ [Bacteroidales bacterium]
MIKKILRIILISLLPLYLLAAYIVFSNKGNEETCSEVLISIGDSIDAPFLKIKDVKYMLSKNGVSPVGKPFSKVNTYKIQQTLEENRIIRRAVCYKTPGNILRIDIEQRNPILRVMGINGDFYIDDRGEYMPTSSNFTAHVPVASGYITKDDIKKDIYKFALFLDSNDFWRAQIDQIYVDSKGEVELIPKVGNNTIYLGDFTNFETKLDNLMIFYKKGLSKRGWNVYKTINLKYDNQVICTK